MKTKANLFRTLVMLWVVLAVVAVVLFGVDPRSAETQTTAPSYYKVQDLGTLGGSASWSSAINDSGQVIGSSYLAGDQNRHAFLYKDGKMTDLGTLGGASSEAKGINGSGQVVGWSDNSSGVHRAFIYDSANGMKDLNDSIPADSGWTLYEAAGINTDGKIAASSYGNTQPDPSIVCDYYSGAGPPVGAALVLSPTTTANYAVQELGYLGGYFSRATSISDSGKVVGDSYTAPCGGERAFFYDEGADPKMQGLSMSEAKGLNDSGKVVGYVVEYINWSCVDVGSGNDCWRAVLYDSATKQMQYLGELRGTYPSGWRGIFGSVANGINDSGDVVGRSGIQDGTYGGDVHAFLKESGQPMIDLNTLTPAGSGWTITSASAINSEDQIAATGHKDGVGTHALLLTLTGDTPPPDDAPSPPSITSPLNNTYDTDGSFSVSGNAEAASTVELFEGTASRGTTKADASSGVWSMALSGVSEGAHTYTAKATDASGKTSSASDPVTVTVDRKAPTGTVTINDGASRTRSRSVTLTLGATDPSPGSGVSQMRIANTQSGLSSESWVAYATTRAWTLTSGKGTKTVYAQYRDAAGNRSATVTDTITFRP